MSTVNKLKEAPDPLRMVNLLNQLLANAIDFRLSAKQAHWNVRGENFISLHELFDRISREADEYADMLAERVAQLGGTAQGSLQAASCESSLSVYPADIHKSQYHIKAMEIGTRALTDSMRQSIGIALDADDMVTADLLTEITRGLDKLHWFMKAHMTE